MKNYSADEEATVFQFMFPFLPATSPSVNIEDQFVEKNEITKPRVPRKSKKLKRGKTVKYHCSCCDFQSPYRNSVKTHQDREHKKEKCRVLMIGCVRRSTTVVVIAMGEREIKTSQKMRFFSVILAIINLASDRMLKATTS